jgi:hypothetical protein
LWHTLDFFAERFRHGEPDPGARPRWENKDLNQGSQSIRNVIGLAIADVFDPACPSAANP